MSEDPVSALLRQSGVAFVGTVERVGAATMTDIPVNDHTVVVRVDTVLEAPASLGPLAGREITVVVAEPVEAAQQLAFFTNVAVLGTSVAVTEVGRLPAPHVEPHIALARATAAQPMATLRRKIAGDDLQAHADAAELVVVGRIIRLEQVGEERYSEHAPHYWRATLQVQHVEKGNTQIGTEITFIYPASQDVRWVGAPNPQPRQQGVWILHATTGPEASLAPFECVHPEDYRPAGHLANLRRSKH